MNVELILVPFDSAQRGARLGAGPERLLEAGLGRALSENGATVRTSTIELPVDSWRAEIGTGFQLAAEISRRVRAAREGGAFPVVLVGNCLSTLGVVAGLGSEVGVLWFDAHGDFNTPETTVGGFLDGMGLAALTGRCWTTIAAGVPGFRPIDESHVFLIGARDIDPLEAELLDGSRINRIDAGSVDATLPSLVRRSLPRDLPVHLHLDLDVTDSADGRANQFAAPNGIRAATLVDTCRALARELPLTSLTVSAYDPSFDTDGRIASIAIATVSAVVQGAATVRT